MSEERKLKIVYASPNTEPHLRLGDVYISKNQKGVFLQELSWDMPIGREPLFRESDDPTLQLNPVYAAKSVWLHDLSMRLPNAVVSKAMKDMIDQQNQYAPARVPPRGTWCYAIRTGTSFNPVAKAQMARALLSPNMAQIKQEILKELVNPRITTFVMVCSGLEYKGLSQFGRTAHLIKNIFGKWKVHPRVDVWDRHVFSTILYKFPEIMLDVVEWWTDNREATQPRIKKGGETDG